jgi:hypothetical protein
MVRVSDAPNFGVWVQSVFAFAAALIIFPDWIEWKIRGHEQGIHPHRRRA